MGFQTGFVDRATLIGFIQFLQRQDKWEAAQELNDILALQDEAAEIGKQSPRLMEWIEELQPVLKAVESWKNGRGREKLFDVYWQQYQQGEVSN